MILTDYLLIAAILVEVLTRMRLDYFAALLCQMVSMYMLFCLAANYLSIAAPVATRRARTLVSKDGPGRSRRACVAIRPGRRSRRSRRASGSSRECR